MVFGLPEKQIDLFARLKYCSLEVEYEDLSINKEDVKESYKNSKYKDVLNLDIPYDYESALEDLFKQVQKIKI